MRSYYLERTEDSMLLCRNWREGDISPVGSRLVLKVWFGNDQDELLVRRFLDAINSLEAKAQGVDFYSTGLTLTPPMEIPNEE